MFDFVFENVSVPWGILAALAGLSAMALYSYLLLPAIRWVIGRRSAGVIAEVNSRLQLRLSPFSLIRRRSLADRLAYDPAITEAIEKAAREQSVPVERVRKQVARIAYEIVPAFNPYFYFRIGFWAARALLKYMYRVRLGYIDNPALAEVQDDAAVVFFMNHRSNMDYVLITYMTAQRTTLSYGIGEWARTWPIQPMMRAAGGYFLRRDSGEPLYRKVLERYVQMATEARVPHAMFAEGALSRDGGLHEPRLGLMNYMTRNFNPERGPDIVFVPIGTNYDRVPEERTVIARASETFVNRGAWFVLQSAGRFIGYLMSQGMRGRRQPFGYACANFGTPVSFTDWLRQRWVDWPALDREAQYKLIGELADELMNHVRMLIPVLPIATVCAIYHRADGTVLSRAELASRFDGAIEDARRRGGHVYLPDDQPSRALDEALTTLIGRRILLPSGDGGFIANPKERKLITYYATSITQFLPEPVDSEA